MYLLDTNVLSELRNPKRADANVLAWALAQPLAAQFLSVITVLELETGVLLKDRKDPVQGKVLRAWLEQKILPQFAGRILPFDLSVAQRCARLHVPDPQAERDAIIAATALVHGMTVVTRNTADFVSCGVTLCNPWDLPVTGS